MTLVNEFSSQPPALGAHYDGDGQSSFLVWAPKCRRVEVRVLSPREQVFPLQPQPLGYHSASAEGLMPGARYFLRLDEKVERPDPASRFQPEGVHGPSEIIDPAFQWHDHTWFGLPLRNYVIYELHVGTFTPEGTFQSVIEHLPALRDLGITALELMPVAQFPGARNWGYDGVFPYAAQNTYGGPVGLRRLVDAAHREGLAVILDVVYNHLGPEGNYLNEFGHYFTQRYRTPWGLALNFDGADSDEVRRYFIENALYWQREFHLDGLRLDAVHAIKDCSAVPFLQELARATRRESELVNRRFCLFSESDLNDPRLIFPEAMGGVGLDAQWSDDFHHCLHVLLTGEQEGYYADFGGTTQLAKILREGYAYTGQYSKVRRRRHGKATTGVHPRQFVVFSQNHDQIGNRMRGERLSMLADLESLKLAAGAVLFSPFIPLLFMGEEYGEQVPFQYVTSHSDPLLVEAVRQGRKEEFAAFSWQGQAPDPQAEATFAQCVLTHGRGSPGESNRSLHSFYREALKLRKSLPAVMEADRADTEARSMEPRETVQLTYQHRSASVVVLLCFASETVAVPVQWRAGSWRKRLDSADSGWHGPGSEAEDEIDCGLGIRAVHLRPKSVVLYELNQQ
jgi:maltooligosyltrehalose trehalohydrolase